MFPDHLSPHHFSTLLPPPPRTLKILIDILIDLVDESYEKKYDIEGKRMIAEVAYACKRPPFIHFFELNVTRRGTRKLQRYFR